MFGVGKHGLNYTPARICVDADKLALEHKLVEVHEGAQPKSGTRVPNTRWLVSAFWHCCALSFFLTDWFSFDQVSSGEPVRTEIVLDAGAVIVVDPNTFVTTCARACMYGR